jgi:putative membrane protein
VTGELGAGWHRLHPLSPFINAGRLLSSLLGIAVLSLVTADGLRAYVIQLAGAAVLVVAGFVRWLVTRWKLDGATLRIETGLLRRDSRQLPMARIQAVDVVRRSWRASWTWRACGSGWPAPGRAATGWPT